MTKISGTKNIKLVDGVNVLEGFTDGVIRIQHNNKEVVLTSTVLRLLVQYEKELYEVNQELLNKYNKVRGE